MDDQAKALESQSSQVTVLPIDRTGVIGRQLIEPAAPAVVPNDFVVSFPREDFPYLEAAAVVNRAGLAWFEAGPHGTRLSALGDELDLAHAMGAEISKLAPDQPPFGFGVLAAELPSIVTKATRERWSKIEITVSPRSGEAVVTQDPSVLTGGTPPAMNLFDDLFDDGDKDLDKTDLTLRLERPSAVVAVDVGEAQTNLHLASFRECLAQSKELIVGDGRQPRYEILEFTDGLAYGGGLNFQFAFEAPTLRGLDLRLQRSQVRSLEPLLSLFDPLRPHYSAHGARHYIFTDTRTTIHARIPARRHPLAPGDVRSKRPNAEVRIHSTAFREKLKALRTGRGATSPHQVLHLKMVDEREPRLEMESRGWSTGKRNARAGDLRPRHADTRFDLLTELALVEKAVAGCTGEIVLQPTPDWLYIRKAGTLVKLTVRIRSFLAEAGRLEAQIRSLPKLI